MAAASELVSVESLRIRCGIVGDDAAFDTELMRMVDEAVDWVDQLVRIDLAKSAAADVPSAIKSAIALLAINTYDGKTDIPDAVYALIQPFRSYSDD